MANIKYLKVKNFSLIKDLEINLDEKLNVIYGESGSGKSLLLSALYILIGGKSSPELIREGEDKAILECEIDTVGVIQKVIGKSRSIQSIDGENVTIQYLKDKLSGLIENFTQGEQEEIYTKEYQLDFINLFIQDNTLPSKVQSSYKAYSQKIKQFNDYVKQIEDAKSKKEFYQYQLNEIENLNLNSVDEEDELNQMINLHSSKEGIISESDSLLNELDLLGGNVSKVNSRILRLDSKFNIKLPIIDMDEIGLSQCIQTIKDELYSRTLDYINLENYSLDDLNSRLYSIQKLKKKLNKYDLKEVIDFRLELQDILKNIDDSDHELDMRKTEVISLGRELERLCNELRDQQKDALEYISIRLTDTLKSHLGFDYVDIKWDWNILSTCTALGNAIPELYISFNKGFEVKPIRKIVSGGEASRLALAFKMLSNNGHILLLDEIDTGLSGNALESMASVLKSINSQIICITHSKEIMNRGDKKIKIYKEEINNKTETRSSIQD